MKIEKFSNEGGNGRGRWQEAAALFSRSRTILFSVCEITWQFHSPECRNHGCLRRRRLCDASVVSAARAPLDGPHRPALVSLRRVSNEHMVILGSISSLVALWRQSPAIRSCSLSCASCAPAPTLQASCACGARYRLPSAGIDFTFSTFGGRDPVYERTFPSAQESTVE